MNFYVREPRLGALCCALVCAFAFCPPAQAQDAGITYLSTANGLRPWQAIGVSDDGSVVVGNWEFIWSPSGGLGVLGNGGGELAGVSADGRTVAGTQNGYAFRWTAQTGKVSLGGLPGGGSSFTRGISRDGSTVVGEADDGTTTQAFRWTQTSGMVALGMLSGDQTSSAWAVSGDGSVVVGNSYWNGGGEDHNHAFRWSEATGMVDLGMLNNGPHASATGVSADGSVVVGWANDGAAPRQNRRAFRWTQATGMVGLGVLREGRSSQAQAVSGDGLVVVGTANDGGAANVARAIRWTQATGMQSVEDWLRDNGVQVASDTTDTAYATNNDGSIVVGQGSSGAFVARVSSGTGNSGMVTLADVQDSLAGVARGGAMVLTSGDLLINGAHSRPLARRVDRGMKTLWLAGDWGSDNHGIRDGDVGLAELGVGQNFGPVQLNVSLGQSWSKQNLVTNGSAKSEGIFLVAEALLPVRDELWATLGGYGQWASTNIRRGYLNAGAQDYSSGKPDINSWGLRARLDWSNAISFASTTLSPYADLSWSEAKMNAYTEAGGSFPAQFNARTERATELRLGVQGERPLANGMKFVSTLEGTHRFEKTGAGTSGQVLGLFNFDLAGLRNKQDWLRAAVGLEGRLAEGRAYFLVNVTTRGEAPNVWVAAGWQLAF